MGWIPYAVGMYDFEGASEGFATWATETANAGRDPKCRFLGLFLYSLLAKHQRPKYPVYGCVGVFQGSIGRA